MSSNKNLQITIPPAFVAEVIAERGEAGQKWLDALPAKFDALCKSWDLVIDGEPSHGHLGLVVPVRRGNENYALKITWPDETARQEILALQTWNGRGAVKLFNAEPGDGALLLERLDNSRSLEQIDIQEAVALAGNLLRRLSVPAPQGLPTLFEHIEKMSATMARRWQELNRPFPARVLKAAQDTAQQFTPSAASLLINHDLHYANVLAGKREPWLVIDPKVLAGDPEFGIFPLLLNRSENAKDSTGLEERFRTLIEAAQLERQRARGLTLVRSVDYWLWALSIGLTEDPKQCEVITAWLLETEG